ncbi:MAG: aldehyde dehydrogenase family protein [Candidatus Brocadiae bacterium]|nr:aldehyde dehydrogenase family protein [Candidatus Brocadiia bacterium]
MKTATRYLNFIGGRWVEAASGRWFESRNPADHGEVVGEVAKSGAEDVDRAVAAAQKAFAGWRLVPAPRRGEILGRVAAILRERKEELSRLLTREMGKVLEEARGDVQESIDTAAYAAGEGVRLMGKTVPSELADKFAMTIRVPVGVCGLISPWNFPTAIPSWKLFPALVSGNTVVFKPASDTPIVATEMVRILEEAGVPAGVVNLVHGGGGDVGMALVRHPGVALISFTGSSGVGREIAGECGKALKRCSLELGGKNASIVMDDADLELAVDGSIWGAFGTTGQRCTATSRVIVHSKVKDVYLQALVKRARGLKLGSGLDESVKVGPLMNEARRVEVHSHVEAGVKAGAKLLCGGRPASGAGLANGWFYEPTVFDGVKPGDALAQEEIFGPVLSVITVDSFDEAIAALNNSKYGLSASIYTRDVNRAFRAIRDVETGILYVNSSTIGAENHLPFGGLKETGNGHREGGWAAYDIYTEIRTVYVDYSGKLQRAQIDNRPQGQAAPR